MRRLIFSVGITAIVLGALGPGPALGQSAPTSEIDALRQELRKLQERLQRLEQTQATSVAPVAAPAPSAPPPALAQRPGETEIQLGREHILETIGLPKPEVAGAKFTAFAIGSFNYASGLQMVPEAFGGTPALADPGRTSFVFNKFGLGVSKVFAPWLSAGAAVEIETHRDRHTHIITDGSRGCPTGTACERFGAEAATTEVNLDRFNLTGVVPIGNGLSLSLGRFDVPFGIERHDENLLVTATTSEIFRFARPQKMTGLQAAYTFAPWLDASAWVVNRWESEDTGEGDFNDNNSGKSVGGRIGLSPFPREGILNLGLGGWYGAERSDGSDRSHPKRWVIDGDITWSPTPKLFFAGEAVYGGEEKIAVLRRVGLPIPEDEEKNKDANWFGFYLLGHYDATRWLGLSLRYSFLDDPDRGRTGVAQTLQSVTFTPILHLSALIPDLRPMGVTVPRTRHLYHWVDLKLEYRWNHSSVPIFGEALPNRALNNSGSDDSQEVHIQAVLNF